MPQAETLRPTVGPARGGEAAGWFTAAPPPPQSLVVFGASGDLVGRKLLPALYGLAKGRLLPERFAIVGYGRTPWDDDAFRAHALGAVERFSPGPVDPVVWNELAARLRYVRGGLEPADIGSLGDRLELLDRELATGGARLYYAATPPSAFPALVSSVGRLQTPQPSRIVIEKPFGLDGAGARHLDHLLHEHFDESQVFRIDHYLGKEAVQNLLVLRFANPLFERIWNTDAIDHVQITAAEQAGIAGRAAHYEQTGATRDMLQSHLLQVLSFVAMEPPRSLEPDDIRAAKMDLLRCVRPLGPQDVVRGQYTGGEIEGQPAVAYRDEEGVDERSSAETFVAARLSIDAGRWRGVPFYLRTGKRLARSATEIVLWLRDSSGGLFNGSQPGRSAANHVHITMGPQDGLSFVFHAKEPGAGFVPRTVNMRYSQADSFGAAVPEPYARLLLDAMHGNHTLFPRADEVRRSWEIVDPVLDRPEDPIPYRAGTWGPPEADRLIAPRAWHLRGVTRSAAPGARREHSPSAASEEPVRAATRVA